jgi:D-beta-D-heptose 7-phosphate kinase/D-beta-D-heptose 1-phosphate adenosyltransferase
LLKRKSMFRDLGRVIEVVKNQFNGPQVLVVGDLMLDRYIWGQVERISPEAPVPVVRMRYVSESAGGAGNVAVNLSRLGCLVSLAGRMGEDRERDALLALFSEHGIGTEPVISSINHSTTVKTRIMGGHQQMLRLDKEDDAPISEEDGRDLLNAVSALFEAGLTCVVLSDYGKGVLSTPVCQEVIKQARNQGVPVLVDPKGCDYNKYAGATGVLPNRGELARVTASPVEDLANLFAQGQKLRTALGLDFVVLTLSELGMALLEPTGTSQFPALAREVFDVSGAGDTVISTMAASLAAGVHLHDAVQLANLAAGIVVGKLGTVPITREELLASLTVEEQHGANKICSRSELLSKVGRWRVAGERIVFTNGCFDLLHAGHVSLLQQARHEGDRLVVGLNSDRSVAALKGPTRPVVGERERARVLAALASVDAVTLFDEDTPLHLIKLVRPDVLVKGDEYTESRVVGAAEVRGWGGKVTLVPLVEGLSTSEVIRRAAVAS